MLPLPSSVLYDLNFHSRIQGNVTTSFRDETDFMVSTMLTFSCNYSPSDSFPLSAVRLCTPRSVCFCHHLYPRHTWWHWHYILFVSSSKSISKCGLKSWNRLSDVKFVPILLLGFSSSTHTSGKAPGRSHRRDEGPEPLRPEDRRLLGFPTKNDKIRG